MGDNDTPGPIAIGAAVTVAANPSRPDEPDALPGQADQEDDSPAPDTRVAVIGDSDFAANGSLGIQGNRDLALNTINWLAQQENLISIRPRQPEDRRITLTADQQLRITWMSLLMIPAAVIGTGLVLSLIHI